MPSVWDAGSVSQFHTRARLKGLCKRAPLERSAASRCVPGMLWPLLRSQSKGSLRAQCQGKGRERGRMQGGLAAGGLRETRGDVTPWEPWVEQIGARKKLIFLCFVARAGNYWWSLKLRYHLPQGKNYSRVPGFLLFTCKLLKWSVLPSKNNRHRGIFPNTKVEMIIIFSKRCLFLLRFKPVSKD